MLTVVCWKWGAVFDAAHVRALKAGLEKHLHLAHELVCITDNPEGLDGIRVVPMPTTFADTPRCRRRMQHFDRQFARDLGARLLCIDLDVVIVDDITPLVDRPEPVVCWKVKHAGVFSGSFLLMDAGALHPLWQLFAAQPDRFPARVQASGTPSDQAMLNWYLRGKRIPFWTERDGFVTYFGEGYEHKEHFGVGPTRRELPGGARIVVLGSADLRVLEDQSYSWVRDHYPARAAEAA